MKQSLIFWSGQHERHSNHLTNQDLFQTMQTEVTQGNINIDFQYGLLFAKTVTQKQLSQIIDKLNSHGFLTTITKDLSGQKPIIFLALYNTSILLDIAQHLHFYKRIIQKDQPGHSVYQPVQQKLNLKTIITQRHQESLNKLDPRILQYEHFSKFNAKLKQLFCTQTNPTDEDVLSIFSSSEIMLIVYSYLHTVKIGELQILHFLKQERILESIQPLHDRQLDIKDNDSIEQYFGSNVAIYFEFMNYYQSALIYLTIFAITVMIGQVLNKDSQFLLYIYPLMTLVWSIAFNIFWKRRESELGPQWGILNQRHDKSLDLNPEFVGQPKYKKSTGSLKLTFSTSQRLFYYVLSLFEALPILIAATFIKLIVFNINGLIKNHSSWLYFPSIAALNKEGGLLHYQYTSSILDFAVILAIFYINTIYIKVCLNSTKRENHKTNTNFNNSVIIKRFVFELINRFFHLFYIAFVEFNIDVLINLLHKLFIMDQIRRVGLESLLPLYLKSRQNTQIEKYKLIPQKKEEKQDQLVENIAEFDLWEYDSFDDYIEVVFQYGYIVLFASIFPIAAPLTYLMNFIEIWSDKFKLTNKLYQRNIPIKTKTLGYWNLVLTGLSILSIYTNTAFMSLEYYNMFELCKQQQCEWRNILIILFILEHLMLSIKYIVFKTVNQKPKWVRVLYRRLKLNEKIK